MKISVCMNTARADRCTGRETNFHIFEYLMEGLREQTFKDFEVVICDVLWEQRKTYFIDHPEKFPIKHIPPKPNIWVPNGYCAISTTKNTCLLYAQGEVVVFTDDYSTFSPKHLELIVDKVTETHCVANTYNIYADDELVHRDRRRSARNLVTYGNIALYLERFLDLNGYCEMYDGSRGLEDCDMGVRMLRSGMTTELIQYPVKYQRHIENYPLQKKSNIKCPRLAETLSNNDYRKGIHRANEIPYTDEEMKILFECSNIVQGHRCKYVDKHGKPVVCTSGFIEGGNPRYSDTHLIDKFTRHPSLLFSLKEMRKDVPMALEKLKDVCKDMLP